MPQVSRSPSNGTASSAVKSGAVELRMTEYDAGMESAANANSMNGSVELTTPITAYWRQCRASSGVEADDAAIGDQHRPADQHARDHRQHGSQHRRDDPDEDERRAPDGRQRQEPHRVGSSPHLGRARRASVHRVGRAPHRDGAVRAMLERQQRPLALDSASVTGERAVGAHDAMARDEDRQRIAAGRRPAARMLAGARWRSRGRGTRSSRRKVPRRSLARPRAGTACPSAPMRQCELRALAARNIRSSSMRREAGSAGCAGAARTSRPAADAAARRTTLPAARHHRSPAPSCPSEVGMLSKYVSVVMRIFSRGE